MIDEIYLGSSPPEEPCAQLGEPDYETKARAECQRYIDLIRRAIGPEPEGARLRIKVNHHDLGSYLEVVCRFDAENEEALDYALSVESSGPLNWEGKL